MHSDPPQRHPRVTSDTSQRLLESSRNTKKHHDLGLTAEAPRVTRGASPEVFQKHPGTSTGSTATDRKPRNKFEAPQRFPEACVWCVFELPLGASGTHLGCFWKYLIPLHLGASEVSLGCHWCIWVHLGASVATRIHTHTRFHT